MVTVNVLKSLVAFGMSYGAVHGLPMSAGFVRMWGLLCRFCGAVILKYFDVFVWECVLEDGC
jgi:hypothetical protein